MEQPPDIISEGGAAASGRDTIAYVAAPCRGRRCPPETDATDAAPWPPPRTNDSKNFLNLEQPPQPLPPRVGGGRGHRARPRKSPRTAHRASDAGRDGGWTSGAARIVGEERRSVEYKKGALSLFSCSPSVPQRPCFSLPLSSPRCSFPSLPCWTRTIGTCLFFSTCGVRWRTKSPAPAPTCPYPPQGWSPRRHGGRSHRVVMYMGKYDNGKDGGSPA